MRINIWSFNVCYRKFNRIKIIPESIGNLTQLELLNLSGNPLLDLPESLLNIKSLKELRLKNVDLTKNLNMLNFFRKRGTKVII